MWRRDRTPRRGARRALALDASGLVTAGRWKALRSGATLWALEEHDGQLWQPQGVSDDPASSARFVLEPRKRRQAPAA